MYYLPKPQIPIINWNHPIAIGLVFDMPFFERGGTNPNDIAWKKTGTLSSGVSWKNDIYGSGVSFPAGTTDNININQPLLNLLTSGKPFTMMSLFKINAANSNTRNFIELFGNGASRSDIWFQFSNGATNQLAFGFTPDGSSFPQVTWTSGWTASSTHLAFGIWDGATQRLYADADASFKASNNQSTGPGGQNSPEFTEIGNASGRSNSLDGILYVFRIWMRTLSANERISLYANPWQIYVRPQYQEFNSISAVQWYSFLPVLGVT